MAFTELDLSTTGTTVTDPNQKHPTPDLLVNGKGSKPLTPGQPQVTPSQNLLGVPTPTVKTSDFSPYPAAAPKTPLVTTAPQPLTPGFVPGASPGAVAPGFVPGASPGAVAPGFVPGASPGPVVPGFVPATSPGTVAPGFVPATSLGAAAPGGMVGAPVMMQKGPMTPTAPIPGMYQGLAPNMQNIQVVQVVPPPPPVETFRDYFFELVTMAAITEPTDPTLRSLAEKAADLSHVPEIDINISIQAKSARKVVAGAVSGLFGVAADAPTADSGWRRERQDHSDSDPISESVLLGRASRARRARSASRRAPPPPPHLYVPARSMYLVASESSAMESDAPIEDQPSSGNNSAIGGRRDDAARIKAARPLCILHATGQPQVEHSMFIAGPGNGAEAESGAPAPAPKHSRKVRPKTARTRRNRVSPVPEAGSPLEPWATAPLSRLSRLIRSSSASTASLASHSSGDQSPRRY